MRNADVINDDFNLGGAPPDLCCRSQMDMDRIPKLHALKNDMES